MNRFARQHRRFFGIAILLAVLLQSFVVANAAPPAFGSHAAAHCAEMNNASQDDCCSCCPEGTLMTAGCMSLCIVHCSNDGAVLALFIGNELPPIADIGRPFDSTAQSPP